MVALAPKINTNTLFCVSQQKILVDLKLAFVH